MPGLPVPCSPAMQVIRPLRPPRGRERMARNAGKETLLGRLRPALPVRSLSPKTVARWLVIAFCLLFWIAILIVFLR